ncbi:MAG TPA: hypothetical protein VHI98_02555 [Vicinamibacterales bacterium]|nr:hypothetical protein [Vicinamibacterales bacterium]
MLFGSVVLLTSAIEVTTQTPPSDQTPDARIKSAMSAAPPEISKNAMIMDWGEKPDSPMKELRAGSNGWSCHPTTPTSFGGASGEDPMCLDKQWQEWAAAWIGKRQPKVTGVGVAYMLRGDKGASNTDPYATGPTANNQWVKSGPHIMVVLPDPKQLEGIPTDPKSGGPFVMWKGTPYAHIMVPVQ